MPKGVEVNLKGLTAFGKSIQGAAHIRTGKECQDHHRIRLGENYAILSVADGHGSASCPYSAEGSLMAAAAFCDLMASYCLRYLDAGKGDLFTFLSREGELTIPKRLDLMWKDLVWTFHSCLKRPVKDKFGQELLKEDVFHLYGTTLLGILVTRDFLYAFQLGDGDIIYVDNDSVRPIIHGDRMLGVETHSLSAVDSWKKAYSTVEKREPSDASHCLYLLSTDGMSNSYTTKGDFKKTCMDYFALLEEYGPETVEKELPVWLKETSEMGCGDDITAVFAYFA